MDAFPFRETNMGSQNTGILGLVPKRLEIIWYWGVTETNEAAWDRENDTSYYRVGEYWASISSIFLY